MINSSFSSNQQSSISANQHSSFSANPIPTFSPNLQNTKSTTSSFSPNQQNSKSQNAPSPNQKNNTSTTPSEITVREGPIFQCKRFEKVQTVSSSPFTGQFRRSFLRKRLRVSRSFLRISQICLKIKENSVLLQSKFLEF